MQHKRTAVAAMLVVAAAAPNAPAMIADPGTAATPEAAPATRYFDLEANKASSMRALGLHMAARREHISGAPVGR